MKRPCIPNKLKGLLKEQDFMYKEQMKRYSNLASFRKLFSATKTWKRNLEPSKEIFTAQMYTKTMDTRSKPFRTPKC